MAKIRFDEEGLLKEPCLSCYKPRLDDLFYEWYCDEKECPYEAERNMKEIEEVINCDADAETKVQDDF